MPQMKSFRYLFLTAFSIATTGHIANPLMALGCRLPFGLTLISCSLVLA